MLLWWTVACVSGGWPADPHRAPGEPPGPWGPFAAPGAGWIAGSPGDTGSEESAAPEAPDTGLSHSGAAGGGSSDTGSGGSGAVGGDTPVADTAAPEAAPGDTGTEAPPAPPALAAHVTASVTQGEYPLRVSFDAAGSDLGSGTVRYSWSFGDGDDARGDAERDHTYLGRGEFDAELTLVDEVTGERSEARVTIEVDRPSCPHEQSPVVWGHLDGLGSASGIAVSGRDPDLFWIVEDHDDNLAVIDRHGDEVSEHDLPNDWFDLEDIAIADDPGTGRSMLFVGDIGDNDLVRDHLVVWVVEEPDPHADSNLHPLEMELEYPHEKHNAETLLVDPRTLDLFIVTKDPGGADQRVFVKRAPHDDEGPFELDDLGRFDELDLLATGGSVSADGTRIVVRDYSDTALMFHRDGYEPFEEAFEHSPCRIEHYHDDHGEAITFLRNGRGIVTTSEGGSEPLAYVEF